MEEKGKAYGTIKNVTQKITLLERLSREGFIVPTKDRIGNIYPIMIPNGEGNRVHVGDIIYNHVYTVNCPKLDEFLSNYEF
ncbi:MAG: hypothetical protein ABIH25_03000 [Candidatus Woesearchaeota archaeon]